MIMERCQQPLLLLWLTAVVAVNAAAVKEEKMVMNLTNKSLQVIPHGGNSSSVTKLVIEDSLITLNGTDRLALACYPKLLELHLDGNLVTSIPAKYFSVVPNLTLLSLSRNKVSSLDPEAFSGLDVLTELDLSHNLLTSLHTQLFRGLKDLKVLNLQENPWNCSCPLLSIIGEVKAAGVYIGGPQVTCASPENQTGRDLLQATAECYPSTPPYITTEPQKSLTPVNVQQSSSTTGKTTQTSQKHIKKDQTPLLGNSWKFTAWVVAFAICILMVIVCAIKAPSWYKLFHDYRHQRLDQEEDEANFARVFCGTGRHMNHQTFTFEQDSGRIGEEEEEEDEYFEDPYIKREESHAGEDASESHEEAKSSW